MLPPPSVAAQIDDEAPRYHSGTLEVKFRMPLGENLKPVLTWMKSPDFPKRALGLDRAMAATQPGLGMLLAYERSGHVRRVTPLARATGGGASLALGAAETPVLSAVAMSTMAADTEDANAGVAIVELHDDADVAKLEAELQQDPTVESVSRVPVRYLLGATVLATPPPAATLWNLAKIQWQQARIRAGFEDADAVQVAVLDSGIDERHPDLIGNIASYEHAHPMNAEVSSAQDVIGHGTHVAGTIAANINNSVGINGICRCRLHAMKIFDGRTQYVPESRYFAYTVNHAMYLRALSRCLSLGVQVVNLSIGGGGAPSRQESELFSLLLSRGTTVVAAMGNTGRQTIVYPAAISGVIAVGATTIDDTRASFSTTGSHIALAAPGVAIWSTLPTYPGNVGYRPSQAFPPSPDLTRPLGRETSYDAWEGTSMATPHVAAAAALLLAKVPDLSPAEVREKLQSSADKVPAMQGASFDYAFGAGRLNLLNLLQ